MTPPERVTACLIVQDEQERLPDALRSVSFCDEIIVVDGGSRDRTVELARAAGARVIENPWPGFSRQRNVALEAASTEWVLELDADERVDPRLAESIQALVAASPPDVSIGACALRHRFLGRLLGPSGKYPAYRFRVFRRAAFRHDERLPVHEGLPASARTVPLDGELEHELAGSLGEALGDVWRYADMQARHVGRPRSSKAFIVGFAVRPVAKMFYRLLLEGGWRDGWRGALKIALDCTSDSLVWLLALMRGTPASDPHEDPSGVGGHFGSEWGGRAQQPKVVAVATGEVHARHAAGWLAAIQAHGTETALLTDVAGRELDGVRLRHLPHVGPLEVLRAMEAENQLLPAQALLPVGRRAQLSARLLPSRLRGAVGVVDVSQSPALVHQRIRALART